MSGKFKLVCLFILYALMLHLSQPQMVCTQHPCGCEAPMPPAGTRLKTGRRPGEKASFYNTTQNILVNGHQYRKFIDIFLLPFFSSRVNSCLKEIKSHNEMILDKLGHKSVKRSTVKYKSGTPFVCNLCDYAAKNISSLNKHKKQGRPELCHNY